MLNFHRYRSLIVPSASALLALLWLIFAPSFEPAIVLIASVAASIVAYNQIRKDWTPRTNNHVYRINVRSPIPEHIDACISAILDSEPAITKWKPYHHDGEFKALVVESIEKLNVEELPKLAWEHKCKPYSVSLGNDVLWETKAI